MRGGFSAGVDGDPARCMDPGLGGSLGVVIFLDVNGDLDELELAVRGREVWSVERAQVEGTSRLDLFRCSARPASLRVCP